SVTNVPFLADAGVRPGSLVHLRPRTASTVVPLPPAAFRPLIAHLIAVQRTYGLNGPSKRLSITLDVTTITNLWSLMVTTHEQETTQRARDLYVQAEKNQLDYWAERARNEVYWDTPFTEVLDWSNPPFARWFADGTTNACYNAVDRHVEAVNGDRVALYFEGEPGDDEAVTYAGLQARVSQAANALEALGVTKGDRVAIYLPMLVEAVLSILACSRIYKLGFRRPPMRSKPAECPVSSGLPSICGYWLQSWYPSLRVLGLVRCTRWPVVGSRPKHYAHGLVMHKQKSSSPPTARTAEANRTCSSQLWMTR